MKNENPICAFRRGFDHRMRRFRRQISWHQHHHGRPEPRTPLRDPLERLAGACVAEPPEDPDHRVQGRGGKGLCECEIQRGFLGEERGLEPPGVSVADDDDDVMIVEGRAASDDDMDIKYELQLWMADETARRTRVGDSLVARSETLTSPPRGSARRGPAYRAHSPPLSHSQDPEVKPSPSTARVCPSCGTSSRSAEPRRPSAG